MQANLRNESASLPDRACAPQRGLLLVLSGPSGCGKTTLARLLIDRHAGSPGRLIRSISVTTRPPRPGEVNGRDYFFIEEPSFEELLVRGELLEHAEVFGHWYGTLRGIAEACLEQGTDMVLVLDGQGRRRLAEDRKEDLVSVFLLPPSLTELEQRLRGRDQDGEGSVAERLAAAWAEISHCREYDYVLVNRHLEETLESLEAILRAERQRRAEKLQPNGLVESL